MSSNKTCVIIPTFNEEKGILKTINSIPNKYDIFIIDFFSKDKTVEIAKKMGVDVFFCEKKGKGNAVKFAFKKIKDYSNYVLIDGDSTYDGADVDFLIEEIERDNDLVIGSRFLKGIKNMSFFRKICNKILTNTFNFFHKTNLTDITSGLRAMKKSFIDSIKLKTDSFQIETELTHKAVVNNFKISEIPVKYKEREGDSKLGISDMSKIYLFAIKKGLFGR